MSTTKKSSLWQNVFVFSNSVNFELKEAQTLTLKRKQIVCAYSECNCIDFCDLCELVLFTLYLSCPLTWQRSLPRSSSGCWGCGSACPACWRSVRTLAGRPSLSASSPAWAGGAQRGSPWAGAADSPHR